MYRVHTNLGKFSREGLERILREAGEILDVGRRIESLSRNFLDVNYADSTLIGDVDTRELFVIDLGGVDCMTFIEYVEAMRRSRSCSDFESNLKSVRYRSGKIDFTLRNHFFTDWREFNKEFIEDATEQVGGEKVKRSEKMLNVKEDGTRLLPGVEVRPRTISFIPSSSLDDAISRNLATGDYIGIYSGSEGIDVSHVGILIRDKGSLLLRHASSQEGQRKVIDQDFGDYLARRPGIVILRAK